MQDAFAQLLGHVLGVWRYRWLALCLAWVIALAGWVFVSRMAESYVATARVFVDSSSVLGPLMRGLTVTPNINERIAMMSRTILSRPNLEKLARMTDLDLEITNDAQKDALIKRLENSISLGGTRGNDSLYFISVTDPSRETARRLAQALITVFIETSMNDKRLDSSGAEEFLDQQLIASEDRLVEAEARLAEFKKANIEVLPAGGIDYFGRLQQAQSDLEIALLQLRELENRQSELGRQLQGEDPIFIASSAYGGVQSALDTRIQSLQLKLDGLLTRYTEKHPDIRRLQGLIRALELEQKREQEQLRNSPDTGMGAMATSPVYQGMRSMMAETQAQIAELKVRVREYQERVDTLENRVNQIPDIEAQLKQLDRDYDVVSRQHQQMLERREAARLSGDVQKNAGDVTFRVIDPPFVPLQPSHPNKPLLHTVVLLVALGVGVAIALLVSLLNPVISSARLLAQTTGLPLLGTVTRFRTAEAIHADRLRLASLSACGFALLLTFLGVLVTPELITN